MVALYRFGFVLRFGFRSGFFVLVLFGSVWLGFGWRVSVGSISFGFGWLASADFSDLVGYFLSSVTAVSLI